MTLVDLRIPVCQLQEQPEVTMLTQVDLRSRPLVPIHGSSRVSEVQVCIRDDLVDGLANSRMLPNQLWSKRHILAYETEALGDR